MKKELRKKCAKIKVENTKTGGGLPDNISLFPYEEKVLSLTQLSMIGLPGRFDCDENESFSALIENADDTVAKEQSILLINDDTIEEGVQPIATDSAASNIKNVQYEDNEREIPTDRPVNSIIKADEDAILNFWDDVSTSGNWHSLVGMCCWFNFKTRSRKTSGCYLSRHVITAALPLSFTNRKEEHEEHQRQQRHGQQQAKRDRTQATDQPSGSRDVSDIGHDETNSPMATDVVDAPQTENSIDNRNGVTNPGR
ncbi:hypothetical protein QE152_g22658 [Popillia japonica]|uniref:Uncharacterized protein n=1 Tax=Popillia japonica TaxID=7064 RepID=A0AAW1KI37_POPJA